MLAATTLAAHLWRGSHGEAERRSAGERAGVPRIGRADMRLDEQGLRELRHYRRGESACIQPGWEGGKRHSYAMARQAGSSSATAAACRRGREYDTTMAPMEAAVSP